MFLVKDVDRASLIYHHFHDQNIGQFDGYQNRIILILIDSSEVTVSEGNRRYTSSSPSVSGVY